MSKLIKCSVHFDHGLVIWARSHGGYFVCFGLYAIGSVFRHCRYWPELTEIKPAQPADSVANNVEAGVVLAFNGF